MKGTWNVAYLETLKLDFYFFPGFVCLSLFSLPPFCPTETIYSSHVSLLMTTQQNSSILATIQARLLI